MTARSGYSLTGAMPSTRYDMASEYYQFDWEFGATPEETSWLGSSWVQTRSASLPYCSFLFLFLFSFSSFASSSSGARASTGGD